MNPPVQFCWTSLAACTTAALAAAAVLAASTAGAAEPYRCTGHVTVNSNHAQVVVPAGTRCKIDPGAHVSVSGNIRIEAGATLYLIHGESGDVGHVSVGGSVLIARGGNLLDGGKLTVKGNVIAIDVQAVYLYDNAKIEGNLKIGSWTQTVSLASVTVDGIVSIDHGHFGGGRADIFINDSRLGELVLKNNEKVFVLNIANNRIARRLECVQDRGQLYNFGGNTVAGRAVDETACPVA